MATAMVNAFVYISSVTEGHTHNYTIVGSDLTTPQTSGTDAPTSMTLGHFHRVVLTIEELMMIDQGGTVTKTTTIAEGHTHDFSFSLATGQPQTTPAGTGVGPGTVIETGAGTMGS